MVGELRSFWQSTFVSLILWTLTLASQQEKPNPVLLMLLMLISGKRTFLTQEVRVNETERYPLLKIRDTDAPCNSEPSNASPYGPTPTRCPSITLGQYSGCVDETRAAEMSPLVGLKLPTHYIRYVLSSCCVISVLRLSPEATKIGTTYLCSCCCVCRGVPKITSDKYSVVLALTLGESP